MDNHLYRSTKNKVFAGVCGGIAEYFRIDPIIVRLICIALATTGAGIFLYIIAIFLIPARPGSEYYDSGDAFSNPVDPGRNRLVAGVVLVGIGVLFLIKEIFHWFNFSLFWPIILILVGVLIVYNGKRRM
jgi:Putative stress-responsive transcriptional regulator